MPTSEKPPATKSAAPQQGKLIPSLGLFSTIMIVVGGVIGSGIFRKAGVMMNELGSPGLLMAVWLLAGLITLCGVLANAELASFIPDTGGMYVYLDRMYGPFVAFLFGWGAFVVIQTGSIAALAFVFSEYTTQFVALPEASPSVAAWSVHLPFIGDITPFREFGVKTLASVVIVFWTVVNYFGAKAGAWAQNIFSIAKLVGMAALVLVVVYPGSGGNMSNLTAPSSTIHKEGLALVMAIVAALQGAFWAYDGWMKAAFISGEVKNPQRVVPPALVYGMLIVTAIYLALSAAYCWMLPADVMAYSKLVAADAAEKAIAGGGKWISLLVMISTFGTTNAVILTSSRVYYSMAEHSTFPKFLARVHPRFHTPTAALIAQGIWGVVLVFSGTFDMLTDTLIFVAWIFYSAVTFGVFILRKKEPNTPRSFKTPGYPIVPALFVLCGTVFLILTVYSDISAYRAAVAAGKPALINSALGAALVLLGTPIYFFCRRKA
jgi:APA family basic amino acid/polyamine antiporter